MQNDPQTKTHLIASIQVLLFSIKIPLTLPILINISRKVLRISVFKLNERMSQYERYNTFENVLNFLKKKKYKLGYFLLKDFKVVLNYFSFVEFENLC